MGMTLLFDFSPFRWWRWCPVGLQKGSGVVSVGVAVKKSPAINLHKWNYLYLNHSNEFENGHVTLSLYNKGFITIWRNDSVQRL